MLSLLHGIFTQRPGAFAVAFPGGNNWPYCSPLDGGVARFPSREDMDWLAENVISQPWFRDYARLSYPRAVPADFRGEWVRFVRYRVPSLSSDRHEGEEHGLLRRRRMETARKAKMTYFILRSAGTGQRFSLVVNREQGEPQREECTPNGYGFCVTSSPFSLPELPWA
ncbi:MAG: type I-F CRISPR-associated endoribonuclease Cas6/Csy4 [Bilophila wadsworthia]